MFRMLLCVIALLASPVHAQESDLAKLREELKQLKEMYERRIQALEERLEKSASTSQRSAGESAFNPGISLILQGTVARTSRDPGNYQITGFAPSGGEVAPPGRGLNLGESELVVT